MQVQTAELLMVPEEVERELKCRRFLCRATICSSMTVPPVLKVVDG